jgi:TetR/AcrR family transcriptional repressor of mexJK operon
MKFFCNPRLPLCADPTASGETRAADDSVNPKAGQLIDAALKLFLSQPYDQVSTDAIARAAKVSKATLYAHFPSKEMLFSAVVSAQCGKLQDDIWNATSPDDDVEEVLRRIARNFLGMFASTDALALYRTILAEVPRFPELGRMFYEAGPKVLQLRIATYLEEATRRGQIDVPDAPLAALQFLQLVSADVPLTGLLAVEPLVQERMDMVCESGIRLFMAGYGVRR